MTASAEPLALTGEPGGPAFRGRYLHIDGQPFGLGRMIGQGDEAMVYELVSLRHGNCGHVVKICRYAPDTERYKRWAVPVRDERSPYANVPDIERYPARLQPVAGGVVKVQPFITADPAAAWSTPYPATDVYRHLESSGPDAAAGVADSLIERHGPRGVLLEAKAVSLWYGDQRVAAESVFEEAIETLIAERNVSRLSATCHLATMLAENYHARPQHGTAGIKLHLDDGGPPITNWYFSTPEEAAADDTEQDRPVMLLLEALAEEPYLVKALTLLAFAICDAPPAGRAVHAIVNAVERIDPDCPDLPQLRQIADNFAPEVTEMPTAPPREPSPEAEDHMARFDRAYQPDPVRGQQAQGRHLAGWSHVRSGRLGDAEREFRSAIALDPTTLEYQLSLVELVSYDNNRLDEARELAEQAARAFPDDPAGYEALARLCVTRGELQEALLAFLRALRAEPVEPWRLEVAVGQTYQDLGNTARAMRYLRSAYEQAPDQPMTAVALAQVLRSESLEHESPGEDAGFQESSKILTTAVERNPDSAEALVSLAQSLVELRRLEEAVALLRRATTSDPGHPFAANFLAVVEQWLADAPAPSSDRLKALPDHTGIVERLHSSAIDGSIDTAQRPHGSIAAPEPATLELAKLLTKFRRVLEGKPWVQELSYAHYVVLQWLEDPRGDEDDEKDHPFYGLPDEIQRFKYAGGDAWETLTVVMSHPPFRALLSRNMTMIVDLLLSVDPSYTLALQILGFPQLRPSMPTQDIVRVQEADALAELLTRFRQACDDDAALRDSIDVSNLRLNLWHIRDGDHGHRVRLETIRTLGGAAARNALATLLDHPAIVRYWDRNP